MTFRPSIWFPIAAVLSAVNVAAVWFAAQPAEPWHATGHAALAVAFGLWAQRLRRRPSESEFQARLAALEALEAVQALEIESGDLKKALGAAQERLDRAERRLERQPAAGGADPAR